MSIKHKFINYFISRFIFLIPIMLMAIPCSYAATYSLSDNNNLVKGCSGTIEIKIDTEGSDVMAGDSTLFIKSGEVTVQQVSIGSPLPMQIFNQVSDNTIKLSGARLPLSGTFNGAGTFGYINFVANSNANSGEFTFSSDLKVDNNLVDDNIENVLTSAVSKVYQFRDRYNVDADGVGFCDPDVVAPNIQFITPQSGSSNIPVDSNIIFVITDNRTGVDVSSLSIVIDGHSYNASSSNVTTQEESGLYRVEVDPSDDFDLGKNVRATVNVCDKNSSANCSNNSMNFRTFTPDPPPPVCGDGIANYSNGEQCDDGNVLSGDGCSSLCLYEIPSGSASCSDGLHNQGEEGIDCGGPCPVSCPTCIDGKKNHGEESVDCGGPCRACSGNVSSCPEVAYSKIITICHYPDEDPENSITMLIPENLWSNYQLKGDTIGACPVFDICTEALLSAAPEREDQAIEEAETIIQQGVVEKQEIFIESPKVLTEVLTQIDICKASPLYASANFDDPSADTDGDGMSDRMECYAETNPSNIDTDGDGCGDFEEFNHYYTNPLDDSDCKVEEKLDMFSDVLITDPQPGWILSTNKPSISGKVPSNTALVLVVATQSEQSSINSIIKAIDTIFDLKSSDSDSEINISIKNFAESVSVMNKFLEEYSSDFNSMQLDSILASIPSDINDNNVLTKEIKDKLESIKTSLLSLKTKPIVVTASTRLQDTKVSDFDAKNFEEVSNSLNDRQLYDLVATAYLTDGTQLSSKAVRFSVDTANSISKPVPRTISGHLITEDNIAFSDFFFGESAHAQVNAEGEIEIEIEDLRPVISGETEFGSQVFAIWNSVVLASSVISDSEQGAFEVQAPRDLETGISHRVTLYAVKTEDKNKMRSESVEVFFTVKEPGKGIFPFIIITLGSLSLLVVTLLVRRYVQARSTMKLFKKK